MCCNRRYSYRVSSDCVTTSLEVKQLKILLLIEEVKSEKAQSLKSENCGFTDLHMSFYYFVSHKSDIFSFLSFFLFGESSHDFLFFKEGHLPICPIIFVLISFYFNSLYFMSDRRFHARKDHREWTQKSVWIKSFSFCDWVLYIKWDSIEST